MTDLPLFNLEKSTDKIKITMDSRMENIDRAAAITKDFLKVNNLENLCFPTGLVIREALTNAVRHANKYDIEKKVFYNIILRKNSLEIEIEDQGTGFDWKKVMNRKPIDTNDHGRGFEIMKTYFNEVEFNEKGTIISLKKIF